jgi:hypothetical protein
MKSLRLSLLCLSTLLLGTAGMAQSLADVVKAASLEAATRPRAKRMITNDDLPAVKEPVQIARSRVTADSLSTPDAKATSPVGEAEGTQKDEVCDYIGALRTEVRQLELRVQKLQASLEKADSDLLRTVYTNALLRLTESLHGKQQELADAEQTAPGASCKQKPTLAASVHEVKEGQ